MIKMVIVIVAMLIPALPMVLYFMERSNKNPLKTTQDLVLAFKGYNMVLGVMGLGLVAVWLASPEAAFAASAAQEAGASKFSIYDTLAAGLAVGLGSIGAGIGVSGTGAAAIGAVSEKPDFLGKSLLYVGLAEGIAIYGLVIAFIALGR